MEEPGAFLAEVMPQLVHEEMALHDGDADPRIAMWSHREPVTLFGAELTNQGWNEIEPAFRWLASTFHHCGSYEYEVLAAGVSGDLAYIVGIEHTTAAMAADADPDAYQLRVTTIFRREDDAWKIIHRHGDPLDTSTKEVLSKRSSSRGDLKAE
ncbi:MAG: hypothetical protein QOI16_2232 [Pseudonocardiales bacterium]|nr:hypothetical protein [Pseudonocardiales bacterium]